MIDKAYYKQFRDRGYGAQDAAKLAIGLRAALADNRECGCTSAFTIAASDDIASLCSACVNATVRKIASR